MNIQHRTFNIQCPIAARRSRIGCSVLDVRCWLFSILLFSFASVAAAQNNGPDTNTLKLLPPYTEIPPTFWERFGATIIAFAIFILLLVAFVMWLILRPKPQPVLPPEIQARRALGELSNRAEDDVCLMNVSRIVRKYFIAAFQIPDDELTTAEFSRAISNHEKIGNELATAVVGFLHECDERKFSAIHSKQPMDAVNRALRLIDRAEVRRAQFAAPQNKTA
jgi:hypothetical protein